MKSPKRERSSQRYTSKEFRPYVTALGQLTLAWNDLQESLRGLFWTLMTPRPVAGDFVNFTPLWVWSAIKSDRSQRDMLRAAVMNTQDNRGREKFREDLKWLLDKCTSLEDLRNDCVHSPLFSASKSLWGTTYKAKEQETVAPASWLFNPRAVALSKRGALLKEFRFCRDTAIKLADYAQEATGALEHPNRPWPNRPTLPSLGQKKARQDQPRQPALKSPSRPRQS